MRHSRAAATPSVVVVVTAGTISVVGVKIDFADDPQPASVSTAMRSTAVRLIGETVARGHLLGNGYAFLGWGRTVGKHEEHLLRRVRDEVRARRVPHLHLGRRVAVTGEARAVHREDP